MEKIDIGKNGFIYPMPVTLLGTAVNGKVNFMALSWATKVNARPPLLGVGVNRGHHSHKGILETKAFSVNFPSADMVEVTDYCGLVSGKKVDKSDLFDIFYGELKAAPMIERCPLCLECRLFDTLELPTNTLFVGEIVASYTEERYLSNGKPDIKKMNPLVLTMPDNGYWTVGEYAGKAWNIGKRMKK